MDCVTYEYEMEVLSPLCVSSGNKLQGFEFTREKNNVHVLDVMKMMKDRRLLDFIVSFNFNPNSSLTSFLKERRVDYNRFIKYSLEADDIAWGKERVEINEIIKTAGKPYIPGSSIKGAMRTSLTRKLDREDIYLDSLENAVRRKKESERSKNLDKKCDDKAENNLFGTPYTSPFRFLKISDSYPAEFKDLELTSIKILNDAGGRIKWFRRGGNKERLEQGLTLYAETFRIGTRLRGRMSLGFIEYFRDYPLAKSEIKNLSFIYGFEAKINEDMKRYINEEIAFYKRYNSRELDKVVSFYEGLSRMRLDENQFLLQIGFASGYKPKSVIVRKLKRDINKKLKKISRGRVYEDLFPKTRRLAVKNGEILYPLGWVKITLR